MKLFAIVVVMLAVCSGCFVRRVRPTPDETCGPSGMVASGFSSSTSNSFGYAASGGSNAWARGRSERMSVDCRRPMNKFEYCQAQASAAAAGEKDFGVVGRNLLVAAGYIAFIVPGVVLYVVFDGQRDDAIRKGNAAGAAAFAHCMQTMPD